MDNQALYKHAKSIIPGGTGLLSKRPEMMAPDVFPPYFKSAKGCRCIDFDGREFIDFTTCGIGACLLGFNDDDVTARVVSTIQAGNFCTLNPPEEVELADRLCAIHPWSSWARFARCGGETCAVAVRIARAATNRSKVIIIGYHGWQDWYLAANLSSADALGGLWLKGLSPHGVPAELEGSAIPCMHGDVEQFEALMQKYGNEIACVIAEPCRHELPEAGFLESLRKNCDKYGSVLIYDEITIGWRLRFGGSHLSMGEGTQPDMAIFSKAMGNGHPIGAVIGNKRTFDGAGKAFLSSTYWTERTGPAAALATIDKMERSHVAEHVNKFGMQVMDLWANAGKNASLPIKLGSTIGCLAYFAFDVENANAVRTLFTQKMLERGFLAGTGFYPTLAHTQKEFDLYDSAVKEVFAELAELVNNGGDAVKNALKTPEAHTTFARLVK